MKTAQSQISPASIRIPTEIREAIERRAEAENRTFSQQVVYVLRQYLESTPDPAPRKSMRK